LQVDEIRWESKEWEAAGSWRELGRGSDARSSNRIQVVSNGIAWRLAQLRIFQIGQMPAIRGWGYAEHLQLSLAPWRLPIRRLRWGRFVNSTDALVWIDWSGSYNKQVAYLNGSEFCAAEISESSVVLKEIGAELDLDKGNVLREGALGSTALSVIPKLNRLFPDSILNVRECKWLSKAVLRRPGQPDSEGMAIHEVVEWP